MKTLLQFMWHKNISSIKKSLIPSVERVVLVLGHSSVSMGMVNLSWLLYFAHLIIYILEIEKKIKNIFIDLTHKCLIIYI